MSDQVSTETAARDELLARTDESGRHWRSWETRPLTVGDRVQPAEHVEVRPVGAPHPVGTVTRVPRDGIPYGSGAFAVGVLWDGASRSVAYGPADLVLLDQSGRAIDEKRRIASDFSRCPEMIEWADAPGETQCARSAGHPGDCDTLPDQAEWPPVSPVGPEFPVACTSAHDHDPTDCAPGPDEGAPADTRSDDSLWLADGYEPGPCWRGCPHTVSQHRTDAGCAFCDCTYGRRSQD